MWSFVQLIFQYFLLFLHYLVVEVAESYYLIEQPRNFAEKGDNAAGGDTGGSDDGVVGDEIEVVGEEEVVEHLKGIDVTVDGCHSAVDDRLVVVK